MVDISESIFCKTDLAKQKLVMYQALRNRCRNVYKQTEIIEAELDDKTMSIDEFCKDLSPKDMNKFIEQIQSYVDKNFNSSIQSSKVLNERIINFYEESQPSTSMISARDQAFDLLATALQNVYKDAKLYKYGSSSNGHSTNTSDLDLTLIFKTSPLLEHHNLLSEISYFLALNVKEVKKSEIRKGTNPILILKLQIGDVTIDVDLSIQSHKTVLNSYVLRQYSIIDKRLPILVCAIKKWAKTNNLFGGCLNRFNSYGLTLFVIQFLQCGVKPPVLPYLNKTHPNLFAKDVEVNMFDLDTDLNIEFESENQMTVLELLAGFMTYYSEFEFEKFRPSILSPTLKNRFNRYNFNFKNAICMIDPCFGNNPCRVVSFATLMQFREATARFKRVCQPNNKTMVEDFEIIFGFADKFENFEEKAETLITKSHFDFLLIW